MFDFVIDFINFLEESDKEISEKFIDILKNHPLRARISNDFKCD